MIHPDGVMMTKMMIINRIYPIVFFVAVSFCAFVYCAETAPVDVVNSFPHDANAFTQGLLWDKDSLIETTGQYGESTLRRVSVYTGEVIKQIHIEGRYFGEGCAVVENKIIVLTWREHTALVFDKTSFDLIGELSYETEGWGLTSDGASLIMSDGSSTLYFRDPDTFDLLRSVTVKEGAASVTRLNELEWIEGEVWANVWMSDRIARIDPRDGQVIGWIDASGLLAPNEQTPLTDVLNGIAYDAMNGRIFITGKRWPKLFEIARPSLQSHMADWPLVR
ncbi:MAG: glutaminyl-peptide cyclotransferase [Candidatus Hinthialibacter antarcticus]|nr:glutaminyl-peptide cyclotransferase [Candidatus Hinthialibacter antarcticus]